MTLSKTTKIDLGSVLAGGPIDGYQENGSRKRRFQRRGLAFLREVARYLPPSHGPVDVRWNPGGPAVSGDLILHSDRVYLCIDPTMLYGRNQVGYCRPVTSRKDYTGGPNHPLRLETIQQGPEAVAQVLRSVERRS